MPPVRILHAHSTFSLGGKEARAVRLMNAFGAAARHIVLTAMPGETGARAEIAAGIDAGFPEDAPPLSGPPSPLRLWRLARYIKRFDLVLSYNWGAMDLVMAHRLFGGPPLVHHEDGFNQDEAHRLHPRRNAWRRFALRNACRVVVPSRRLEDIARIHWARQDGQVVRIANGIDTPLYAGAPDRSAIGLDDTDGRLVIGTVAGLRPVKNLPRLVRAFAAMRRRDVILVVVGEGPERDRILAEARRLGVADRVRLAGFRNHPARWIGAFDIFALSSDSEQFPISLIEAMAAGLPAVATAVGDVATMVADANAPLIVDPGDETAFAAALDTLAARADLRRAIGEANRDKAAAHYDAAVMIAAYAALYGEAIGRPQAFSTDRA
ncbi:glycosyltransferase [Sphingosinicella sp. BN140058]|uniref:glycosyltransferase n=1 Tax=Sphingosinicella sp. BN140058 TaxID=1892855 RepID=UPI001010BC18|nr:glycosyltransferase [Sphingosinicella sp. BN140058]QAY75206.1 glycosyltransferase [Sphingosinicella sp. BN140058]